MPTETAEPLIEGTPEQEAEFGTKIADLWDKIMPVEEEPTPEKSEKVEEPKKEEVKKEEPKKEEPKKSESKLPDSIFEDQPTKVEPVKEEEELKKDEPPPELKGKARENFQRLADEKFEVQKQLRDERKAREKAESKLSEGDPGAKARIQELETKIQQMSSVVERASLENHPDFQARYEIPRKQLLEIAKTAYSDAGGNPADIEAVLNLTGKARIEKLEELLGGVTSKLLANKIERAAENLELVDSERSKVLENRSVVLKQLQEQDNANKHKFLEQHEKITRENLGKAKEMLRDTHKFEIFKTVDDPKFAWFNEQQKKMDQAAETLMLKTSDPAELAVASYLAVSAPVYRGMLLEERQARIAAEKRLAQYESSEPSLGGGDKKSASQLEAEQSEDAPLADSIIKSIKKAQGRS